MTDTAIDSGKALREFMAAAGYELQFVQRVWWTRDHSGNRRALWIGYTTRGHIGITEYDDGGRPRWAQGIPTLVTIAAALQSEYEDLQRVNPAEQWRQDMRSTEMLDASCDIVGEEVKAQAKVVSPQEYLRAVFQLAPVRPDDDDDQGALERYDEAQFHWLEQVSGAVDRYVKSLGLEPVEFEFIDEPTEQDELRSSVDAFDCVDCGRGVGPGLYEDNDGRERVVFVPYFTIEGTDARRCEDCGGD